jgi:peptide methionine sulfoxide reductase MsrB
MEDTRDERARGERITFYDVVSGLALFVVPGASRTWSEFIRESETHGWPSFRDDEIVREHVRVLPDGETVSITGTHLGHNLPDSKGNRHCVNIVCVAGVLAHEKFVEP